MIIKGKCKKHPGYITYIDKKSGFVFSTCCMDYGNKLEKELKK